MVELSLYRSTCHSAIAYIVYMYPCVTPYLRYVGVGVACPPKKPVDLGMGLYGHGCRHATMPEELVSAVLKMGAG